MQQVTEGRQGGMLSQNVTDPQCIYMMRVCQFQQRLFKLLVRSVSEYIGVNHADYSTTGHGPVVSVPGRTRTSGAPAGTQAVRHAVVTPTQPTSTYPALQLTAAHNISKVPLRMYSV